jgi:transposase-like protein
MRNLELSDETAISIVQMYKNSDMSQCDVALRLGVCRKSVGKFSNNPVYQQMVAEKERISLEKVQRQLEEKKKEARERGKAIYSNGCRGTRYYKTTYI